MSDRSDSLFPAQDDSWSASNVIVGADGFDWMHSSATGRSSAVEQWYREYDNNESYIWRITMTQADDDRTMAEMGGFDNRIYELRLWKKREERAVLHAKYDGWNSLLAAQERAREIEIEEAKDPGLPVMIG